MRLTTPKMIRVAGEQHAEVDLSAIQIPIDIVVGGGLFALSRDTRLQMDQELIAMASNPLFAQWFKPNSILRRWMQDRGWKNPESYLKTEEEVQNEMAQQAAAMGAEEGGNGATPPANVSDLQLAGQGGSLVGGMLDQGRIHSPPS